MSRAEIVLQAPCDALVVPLEQVPDPVFAGGQLGPGLAIEPLGQTLHAPCAGTVVMCATTRHALTLRLGDDPDAPELLLHLGLDTVELGGRGIEALVAVGQQVEAGAPLLRFDADLLAREATSLVTPLVFIAGIQLRIEAQAPGRVTQGETLARLSFATDAGRSGEAGGQRYEASATVALEAGLHARPAAKLKAIGERHASRLSFALDGAEAEAGRLTAMLGLGIGFGSRVAVRAEGGDAAAALREAIALLETAEGARSPSAAGIDAGVSRVLDAIDADGVLRGVAASTGVAVAPLVRLRAQRIEVARAGAGVEQELARFDRALGELRTQLGGDRARATREEDAQILAAHLEWLDDPELTERTVAGIERGESAGFAWRETLDAQIAQLERAESALIRSRAGDLRDLEQRLLALLEGVEPAVAVPHGAILVADDLTPSQLIQLDSVEPKGLCLAAGGATSHVAILARARGLPCLVGMGQSLGDALDDETLESMRLAVLDAELGTLELRPGPERLAEAQRRRDSLAREHAEAFGAASSEARTRDGALIEVAANIGHPDEAEAAFAQGADGIGLFRSEFLFLDRPVAPDRERQRADYQAALDAMQGKPVIIRTLDIGADKQLDYLRLGQTPNPALGMRGVRLIEGHQALLVDQLRALLECRPLAGKGGLRIMLPMVTDLLDVRRVREWIDTLVDELGLAEDADFVAPELGVMIEVPAAALCAASLAREVDFFSIGTNDLTQYTLAMDREAPGLGARMDALHPAVLRLVRLCVEGAALHGRKVGVCGAAAGDEIAAAALIALGVDELSMEPARVPAIKAWVRRLDRARLAARIDEALALDDAAQVRSWMARSITTNP